MEYLCLPALEVIPRLNEQNIKYKLCYSLPLKNVFKVDDNKLYIVRVRQLDDVLELTLAAKMRKEV